VEKGGPGFDGIKEVERIGRGTKGLQETRMFHEEALSTGKPTLAQPERTGGKEGKEKKGLAKGRDAYVAARDHSF